MTDHEQETRERYQSQQYALGYKQEYNSGWSIRSRVISVYEVKTIEKLLEQILDKGSSVIDIPCGTGKLGKLLSGSDISILAADVSNEMIALAKEEYDLEKTTFKLLDATNLSLENNSYDVIVCLRLFQRIEQHTRKKILDEFYRVVKSDIIISYSYSSGWQKIRNVLRRLYDTENNKFFSPNIGEIVSELESSGFKVEKIKPVIPLISGELIIHASKL